MVLKFGRGHANALRRDRLWPGAKGHLDEVLITINSVARYLWHTVDQDSNILDILVQSRRNKVTSAKFVRELLGSLEYAPRVLITDKLASSGTAQREVPPSVEYHQHQRLNNRAKNSHQPTRERRIRDFKSPGHAQRLLAVYGPITNHFRPRRHRLNAVAYHATHVGRFATWRAVTGTPAMA